MYPPALSKLAKQYFCVSAFSRPVEQEWMALASLVCPERCPLTDTVIENLTFIKCNSYILDLH